MEKYSLLLPEETKPGSTGRMMLRNMGIMIDC